MNISPHHQRPTRYPWPGTASRAMVAVGIVIVVIIGFILIANPFANGDDEDSGWRPVPATDTRSL